MSTNKNKLQLSTSEDQQKDQFKEATTKAEKMWGRNNVENICHVKVDMEQPETTKSEDNSLPSLCQKELELGFRGKINHERDNVKEAWRQVLMSYANATPEEIAHSNAMKSNEDKDWVGILTHFLKKKHIDGQPVDIYQKAWLEKGNY